MGDPDQVERALAMQEGSVLANEVLRLRARIYELEIGVRSAIARGDELALREAAGRTLNEELLQQHADEVMALDRVRELVESDRDVDENLGTLPRWSSTELERVLEGRP